MFPFPICKQLPCISNVGRRHLVSFFFGVVLSSHASAEACLKAWPMHNPREGTSVVLCDTIRLTWWCVWCVVVARPLLIERCVGLSEGSGVKRPCAMIFTPDRPISTVFRATNTHCMMDDLSSSAPRTVGPRVQFSSACEQSRWWSASTYSRQPSVISNSSSD